MKHQMGELKEALMETQKQVESNFIDHIAEKSHTVLIKFKTMNDILNKEAAWFDHHGNLRVHCHYGDRTDSLCPSYFRNLGKTVEYPSHHSFPSWCIEREWDDLFATNNVLRHIASGKIEPERMVELAKKAVLKP
jgi:hypothetical protein